MHTAIRRENPFGYDRYGFAWEHLREGGPSHLDFGCGEGAFLEALKGKGIGRVVGVDISRDAAQEASRRCPETEIIHLSRTVPLPFGDGEFESVTVLDVIEHVHEQVDLLGELHRVLRDDGMMILTVPGQHLFSFLDAGNLKFRFPRLHRWYYCRRHSAAEYERRYVHNRDGLVGDVSSEKRWHEHFSRKRLKELLGNCGFVAVELDGSGFFSRVLKYVDIFVRRFKPVRTLVGKLMRLDAKAFESTNLFCITRKSRTFRTKGPSAL